MTPQFPLCAALALSTSMVHAQWQQVGPNGSAYGIVAQDGMLYSCLQGGDVLRSQDHGDTWTPINNGITEPSNWWLAAVDNAIFCGTQFGPSFRSTDNGDTWTDVGLDGARGFTGHNDTLYACQWYTPSVFWSVDNGDTWNATTTLNGAGGLWPMLSWGDDLLVGGQTGGVYRTPNSNAAWTTSNSGLANPSVYAFAAMGDVLFTGTVNDGVYRSDDNGVTWTASGLGDTTIYALHVVDSLLFAGTSNHGVMLSTDTGATWTVFNDGLTNFTVARITNDDQYLYVGTLGGGVYRYGTQPNTGLEERSARTDAVAFPNPCDGSFTLQVQLAAAADVSATLVDATGSIVAGRRLGRLSIGSNNIAWNLHDLAPGLYVLRVQGNGRFLAHERLIVQ